MENSIQLIFSSPRHPTTNGIVERLYQEIVKSLYEEKLKKYDIKYSLSNAIRAQNSSISTITKHTPIELFFNNTEEISKEVKYNMI